MSALPDVFDMGEDPMGDRERPWRWPMGPPEDGFTAEDLDRIEGLPEHTELIDGNLVFVSPQRRFHSLMVDLLAFRLRERCPHVYRVRREMTVTLGKRQRPEPDLMVVRASADRENDQTTFKPDDVRLVVEVESPDSEVRDRVRKPQIYAEAGIPTFWRVLDDEGHPAVHTYALDEESGAYNVGEVYHDRLRVADPFEVDIDLTAIDEL